MAWPGGAPLGIGMEVMEGDWQPLRFEAWAPTRGWAWRGAARLGWAEQGFGMDAMEGEWHTSGFESPTPTRGMVWRVLVRPGEARLGQVRLGLVFVAAGWQPPGFEAQASTHGSASVGRGAARFGMAPHGEAWARVGTVRRGLVRPGRAVSRLGQQKTPSD